VSANGRQEAIVKYIQSEVSGTPAIAQQPKKISLFSGDEDEYGAEKPQQ